MRSSSGDRHDVVERCWDIGLPPTVFSPCHHRSIIPKRQTVIRPSGNGHRRRQPSRDGSLTVLITSVGQDRTIPQQDEGVIETTGKAYHIR